MAANDDLKNRAYLRVCHDCGHSAVEHDHAETPCQSCGSQDTRRVPIPGVRTAAGLAPRSTVAEEMEPSRERYACGLVLSRRVGEAIEITHAGATLRIEIAGIHCKRVALRFLGPPAFAVHRLDIRRKRPDETPQDMEDDRG